MTPSRGSWAAVVRRLDGDELIQPDEPWDIDHETAGCYVGPSHAYCNGAAANELRTSRDW